MCIGRKDPPTARAVFQTPQSETQFSPSPAAHKTAEMLREWLTSLFCKPLHAVGLWSALHRGGCAGFPGTGGAWCPELCLTHRMDELPQGGPGAVEWALPSPLALGSHLMARGGVEAKARPKSYPGTGHNPGQSTGQEPGWEKCTGASCESALS